MLLGSPSAHAWPPIYGAEFTFTNEKMIASNINGPNGEIYVSSTETVLAQNKMLREVQQRCPTCKFAAEQNHYGAYVYKVTYPDGFWFAIATDPEVVEIQTKPMPLDQMNWPRIQKDIFDSAAAIGAHPHIESGGGHINIGMQATFFDAKGNENSELFRNFMADYANHPGLAMGALEKDLENAPAIAELTKTQRKRFAQTLEFFDEQKKTPTIRELAQAIEQTTYSSAPGGIPPYQKYQAVSVQSISDDSVPMEAKRFEMRAIRTQFTADEFRREALLFEKRLESLKDRKRHVHFNNPNPIHKGPTGGDQYYA